MKLPLHTPVVINGKGNSLWGRSDESYTITHILFNGCQDGEPYEVQLFGDNTEWNQYTDSQIEKEVNEKLLDVVQQNYPTYKIAEVCWSEQGMQPRNGWSFDVLIERKA